MEVSELKGRTLLKVERTGDEIIFYCRSGDKFKLYHEQSCCEGVYIEDINGDLDDLVDSEIIKAEEVNNEQFVNDFDARFTKGEYDWLMEDKDGNYKPESYTWTFYKFATLKG